MSEDFVEMNRRATELLEERYIHPIHAVAATIKTSSGAMYSAVNVDHFSGSLCAEMAALSSALNNGEREFTNIVAVRKDDDRIQPVAMCGKCRQIFYDYAPRINVAVPAADGTLRAAPIEELLPGAFSRQRDKIQQLLQRKVVA